MNPQTGLLKKKEESKTARPRPERCSLAPTLSR